MKLSALYSTPLPLLVEQIDSYHFSQLLAANEQGILLDPWVSQALIRQTLQEGFDTLVCAFAGGKPTSYPLAMFLPGYEATEDTSEVTGRPVVDDDQLESWCRAMFKPKDNRKPRQTLRKKPSLGTPTWPPSKQLA